MDTDLELDENDPCLVDGYSAHDIFSSEDCMGITFDDLITLPGFIDFAVNEVDLTTNVTRNFTLATPLCSTPMDTVTEPAMAIGMALQGGIGFIHANCTTDEQVSMVSKVKNYENGFILEPAVLSPNHTVSHLDMVRKNRNISGVPVTVDGKLGSKLVGIVSNRDTDFIEERSKLLSEVMTPLDKLVTGTYPISIADANNILKVSKKGYLPIVDSEGNLRALTTRTDLKKNRAFPLASKDAAGKLLVGAAVKANSVDSIDRELIAALHAVGCNIIVLDAQNGDSDLQVEYIKYIKTNFPAMDVIAGNIVRSSQARILLEAGADALRVGMGVGSVATTQLVKAVGRPQLSSIFACSLVARQYGVPVIADGGIKNTGCLIKALSIGANCVMMGSLLAGVTESPGEYYFQDGMRLKHYRGTTSNAPKGPNGINIGGTRVAAGVNGAVVDKGPLARYFPFLCQSVRHGFQDMGVRSLHEAWDHLHSGKLRFELRSPSAQKEGGVHDLHSFTQRLYA